MQMATYDDGQWILSLIQNAYVTTDDTGICEVILQGAEAGKRNISEYPFLYQEDELFHCFTDEPKPHSPDVSSIEPDMKFSNYRHRSHTQLNSEKLRKEREKASRVKNIYWKYKPESVPECELSEMFQRKAFLTRSNETSDGEPPPRISLLTHLLETCPETNVFIEYSKFDGMTHNNVVRQQLKIFLYNGRSHCHDYPLPLSVVSSARVVDLIGLICWIYTKENYQPPLKSVEHYEIHIADEDGCVDWEFHPLERRDLVEKYRFGVLALVEKEAPDESKGIEVTVNFAKAFSVIEVENTDITLREILTRSISRRKEIVKLKEAGVDYHLEKDHEPGVTLDLNKTLLQTNCTEFAAVRDNSKRSNGHGIYRRNYDPFTENQTFFVCWERKRTKFETKIDISGEMVEIHPMQAKGSSGLLLGRPPHPLRYPTSHLVDCTFKEVLRKKRAEVQITMQGEYSFKDYKFLCEPCVGQSLHEKCRHLIRTNLKKDKKPDFKRRNSFSLRRKTRTDSFSNEA